MIGETISHYRILEKLGEGGMGVVYKARDLDLDRSVAIKFLPPQMVADKEATKRFTHEAKTASALNHPNIGVVHEIGHTDDDQTFMVMACYEGESLRERIDRGGMNFEEALDITAQVSAGLAKAHGRGIVHRDIKPSNVLLTEDGNAVIIDFGLAKLAGRTKLTREGSTLGTAAYMSPEQARGEEVDHRSDIFSLGVMLYEMLAGERPFRGEHEAALLYEIVHEEPESLESYDRALPAGAQLVMARALAKDRDSRYESSAELLTDIKAMQEGSKVSAIERRTARKTHRRALLYTACGIIIVAAAYIAVTRLVPVIGTDDAVPIEPTVVAVLPFDVRGGGDLADLGEGMVDLLSTKLDGAGELRSVDPRALISHVRRQEAGMPDAELGRSVAEKFGAGLYLLGDIMAAGDQVHINASLYEVGRGDSAVAEATVEGPNEQVLALVDDLALQLLRDRLTGENDFQFELGAVTTTSYPALKAYLEGEAHWNEDVEKSIEAFKRAADADSTFALAWFRLSLSMYWFNQDDASALEILDQAFLHSNRLPESERLRIRAFHAMAHHKYEDAEQMYRTIVNNYPDDVWAWHALGMTQLFGTYQLGRSPSVARAALERALELDPGFWQAIHNLNALAVFEGDYEEYESTALEYSSDGTLDIGVHGVLVFASDDREAQDRILEEMSALPDHQLMSCVLHVADWTDDLERARDVASLMTHDKRSNEVRGLGHIVLAHLEAARGRWQAAKEELRAVEGFNRALAIEHRALLAAAPFLPISKSDLETIETELLDWNADAVPPSVGSLPWLTYHDGLHPSLRIYLLGLMNVRLGNLEKVLEYADELERMESPERASGLVKDYAVGLRAQVFWERDKAEKALEQFELTSWESTVYERLFSPFFKLGLERFIRAEVLHETGRHEEALGWTSSFNFGWNLLIVYRAPIHLRQAEHYERLGQYDEAIEQYSKFVEIWKDCDEELRPIVDDANRKLEALTVSKL